MSDATICDRCGSVMTNDPPATFDTGTVMREIDLCGNCAKGFRRWMNQQPVNPLENAMRMHDGGGG